MTQLLKGVLDLAVLAVIAEEDAYGDDIVRRLREAGLEEVGDASVYGTLRRLFQAGALTSYVVPSEEGGTAPDVAAVRSNGDFDAYWQFHLGRERHRVHESRDTDGVVPAAAWSLQGSRTRIR